MLKQAHVDPSEAIYIGDDVFDGMAARRVKMAFGAVGWGYAHLHALQASGPCHAYRTIDEMMACIAPAAVGLWLTSIC